MEIKKLQIIVLILCIVWFSAIALIIISGDNNVEYSGNITMKWDIQKLLVHRYYFEIDNETKLSIDSYHYHKYNIGDNYTWIKKE